MASVRECSYVRLINKRLRLVVAIPFLLWLLNPSLVRSGASDGQITVNQGRYGSYYHLRLALKADVIDFGQSDRVARSGGQFELKLHREKFPVPAPNCRGPIILRMPWTSPQAIEAKKKIAAKEHLLRRILMLENHPNEAVSVVIELNPYVEVVSRTPLKVQLTQCNVFFRDASGAYIDDTEPLNPN